MVNFNLASLNLVHCWTYFSMLSFLQSVLYSSRCTCSSGLFTNLCTNPGHVLQIRTPRLSQVHALQIQSAAVQSNTTCMLARQNLRSSLPHIKWLAREKRICRDLQHSCVLINHFYNDVAQSCLISQVRSRNLFAERTSRLSIFVLSRVTQSALLRNLFLAWIPIHLSQLIVKLSMMAMVLVRDIRQKVDTWYLEKHEKNRELGLVITWFCKRHARVKSY